jgi:truncated hemoglobin YjbI
MLSLFESPARRSLDEEELGRLRHKHGERIRDVLRERAEQAGLSPRDRKHWQRLLRKAT